MSAHAATPNRPSVEADAQRVYEVLKAGGIAICPADIGYAVMTCDPRKLEKIFLVKQRAATKRHAMIGSYAIHKDLHVMTPQHAEIVDHLTQDLGLPLGVIAPFKKDHPMLKAIDDVTMDACAVNGTISILTNAGRFQDELTKRTHADNLPILGSSANLTGTGTKYRIEDINPEILDIADIVINYGLLKWHIHARSSTCTFPRSYPFSPCRDLLRLGSD